MSFVMFKNNYALVGGAPEAYGSRFVYVCVCVYHSKELQQNGRELDAEIAI